MFDTIYAVASKYEEALRYFGQRGWCMSRPSEREMTYQICDDIFSYKRMQVFNNFVFQIFTYGDDVPFEISTILGLYAIFAIKEPVRATSELRTIIQTYADHMGIKAEVNYIVD